MARLGIFGGTFDPIHYGHLLLAETCRESCRLDRVLFVPAAMSPHKRTAQSSSADDRAAMVEAAIASNPAFELSTIEIERGGVSYTVETLRKLRESRPGDELFLLVGGDSLVDLPTWREAESIFELATIVAVGRPDSPELNGDLIASVASPEARRRTAEHFVRMPLSSISASEIRQRVSEGKSVRYHTPDAVIDHIERQRLYLGENR